MDLSRRIEQLERENAELRSDVKGLQNENWRVGTRLDALMEVTTLMALESGFEINQQRFPKLWQTQQPAITHQAPSRPPVSNQTNRSRAVQSQNRQRIQTFSYSADQDRNGVMYWLGTQHGTAPWQNPHILRAVCVYGHQIARGEAHNVVDHTFTNQVYYTTDDPNGHVTIDLQNYMVRPTTYTIAHRAKLAKFFLRSWVLLGSVDGEEWRPIVRHSDDQTLRPRRFVASFDIDDCSTFYRMFRFVINPQGNSEHTSALVISCFELYGDLIEIDNQN